MRIGVNLSLVDQAAFVIVQKLDRIFDRQDVLVTISIDLVDHGRERRRLAGAGWASDKNQTARFFAELFDDRRQTEIFEGLNLIRDGAKDCTHSATLVEKIGAKP